MVKFASSSFMKFSSHENKYCYVMIREECTEYTMHIDFMNAKILLDEIALMGKG